MPRWQAQRFGHAAPRVRGWAPLPFVLSLVAWPFCSAMESADPNLQDSCAPLARSMAAVPNAVPRQMVSISGGT